MKEKITNIKMKKMTWRAAREKVFIGVVYLFFIAFTFLCIYPFYYVIIYSISDPARAVMEGISFWPKGFSLKAYVDLFEMGQVVPAFGISVSRTVLGTLIGTLCTSALAFLMTRQELLCRKLIYRYFILTMYLGAGLVPWYLTMKAYHLTNTYWAYIIPGAISAYNMILVKTYMEQLPESLEEAAVIEGAGIGTIFVRIIMPLSKPIIATISVYNAVGQWNSWTDNFYLVHDRKLQTLQLILNTYLRSAEEISNNMMAQMGETVTAMTPKAVQMTIIVISVIPIMLVYPWAQKYFTKGIMVGAIKG